MTAMTKKLTEDLVGAVDHVLVYFPNEAKITRDIFNEFHIPDEERELLRKAEGIVADRNLETMLYGLVVEMPVPDFVPVLEGDPILGSRVVKVAYSASDSSVEGLQPSTLRGNSKASQEVRQSYAASLTSLVERGFERAMVGRVRTYIENASSLEELRYLIPATTLLLRRCDRHDLAAKIEEVRRRPGTMQELTPFDIGVIRWVNTWFATQTLLGTIGRRMNWLGDGTVHLKLGYNGMGLRTEMNFKV